MAETIRSTFVFGEAQKKGLSTLLDEIKKFHFPVSIYDTDAQYVFALSVRDLVARLQTLAVPILPEESAAQLKSIMVDVDDFNGTSRARAELKALVPIVEDAIEAIETQPKKLLPLSLENQLEQRNLDAVSKALKDALLAVEPDPPKAITDARIALESLLKTYIDDRSLERPRRPQTNTLLKVAMGDLGLDAADRADADKDVKRVLQSLWSIVDGIAALRTHAGSAHGHGRRPYQTPVRHARLAVQAAQTFIEFFVETWNYHHRLSEPD